MLHDVPRRACRAAVARCGLALYGRKRCTSCIRRASRSLAGWRCTGRVTCACCTEQLEPLVAQALDVRDRQVRGEQRAVALRRGHALRRRPLSARSSCSASGFAPGIMRTTRPVVVEDLDVRVHALRRNALADDRLCPSRHCSDRIASLRLGRLAAPAWSAAAVAAARRTAPGRGQGDEQRRTSLMCLGMVGILLAAGRLDRLLRASASSFVNYVKPRPVYTP